ncbi:hypothetical protein [Anaeromyxobacter oryzae]|uniref:DUF2231 domain-containing protein n=1 Tax=Anaeromyxobacter oryzae TaxID=2918170 RepID=A0ABM7WTC7_9BACT|nr:hypothetical protein [Anaeromyxobacter oryzae]BDG02732.1 hypothetical protein AMOR_17280 [Anaeromyxobacter oryzae]
MSNLPLHPAIVHIPLGLAFVVPLVAIGLAIALWRRRLPRGAFAVLVGLQLVLVAGGGLAMKLGERDEKTAERVVPEKLIEEHEERAELFLGAAGAVLAGMIAVLIVPAGAAAGVAAVVAAGTLAVAGLAVRTGEAGGALVYQHGAAAAYLPAGSGGTAGGLTLPAARRADGDDD